MIIRANEVCWALKNQLSSRNTVAACVLQGTDVSIFRFGSVCRRLDCVELVERVSRWEKVSSGHVNVYLALLDNSEESTLRSVFREPFCGLRMKKNMEKLFFLLSCRC